MLITYHMVRNVFNNKSLKPVLHIGFWGLIILVPFFTFPRAGNEVNIFKWIWLPNLNILLAFYLNYWILVDLFFMKDKKTLFFLINIALIIGLTFLAFVFEPMLPPMVENDMLKLPGNFGGINKPPPMFNFRMALPLILSIGISVGIKINHQLSKKEILLEKIKQSQLITEINYLKHQVQPHFLFNTLNNIYSLVLSDPEKARVSIHGLSKMMRYLLHEATANRVPLYKEIEFLKRYIDLMLLRVNSNFELTLLFPEIVKPIQIPPLLLISFIENAFKHGIDAVEPCFVNIELSVQHNSIHYLVQNSFFRDKRKTTDSGIGRNNLRKRLELIYGSNFQLTEKEINNVYSAKLILNLTE